MKSSVSRRRILLLAGVLLAVVAAGHLYWKFSRARAERAAPQKIAIVPFENQSGDPELDWPAVYVAAAAARQLEVLPRTAVFRAPHSNEASARAATRILGGRVLREQGNVRLVWTLEDPRPREIKTWGEMSAPAPDWVKTATGLASAVGASIRPENVPAPAEVHNGEAARWFAEGLSLTDPVAAEARFEKCVAADPGCGWCWQLLAETAGRSKGREAVLPVIARSRAEGRNIGVLSRARLDLLEAGLRDDPAARLSALERIARALPEDAGVLNQLAAVYTTRREFAKAAGIFQRAVQTEPRNAELWNTYAYTLAYAGRFEEAHKAVDQYGRLDSTSANPADSAGEIYMMAGNFTAAARSFVSSYEKDRGFNNGVALEKAALARWLAGDRREAGKLAAQYLGERARRVDPLEAIYRARWETLFGQTAAANRRLAAVAATARHPVASLAAALLALHSAWQGDVPAARTAAQQALKLARIAQQQTLAAMTVAAVDAGGPIPMASPVARAQAMALRATFQGDWQQAAVEWRRILDLANGGADGVEREMLAFALAQAGKPAEATPLIGNQWPLLTPEQMILYDFLVYPNLFYTRALISRPPDAQKYFDLFLQYSGDRRDRFGMHSKAKAASRL